MTDLNIYSKEQTDTLLAGKQASLVSGSNIKTINGSSIIGSGDLSVTATATLPYYTIHAPVSFDNFIFCFVNVSGGVNTNTTFMIEKDCIIGLYIDDMGLRAMHSVYLRQGMCYPMSSVHTSGNTYRLEIACIKTSSADIAVYLEVTTSNAGNHTINSSDIKIKTNGNNEFIRYEYSGSVPTGGYIYVTAGPNS